MFAMVYTTDDSNSSLRPGRQWNNAEQEGGDLILRATLGIPEIHQSATARLDMKSFQQDFHALVW